LARLVLRLSRRAKIAATVAGLGALLVLVARYKGPNWLGVPGTAMLFGGVVWYYTERLLGRKRDG